MEAKDIIDGIYAMHTKYKNNKPYLHARLREIADYASESAEALEDTMSNEEKEM